MAYYLFVHNATFSWRATLLQIVALSTTEAELMALASFCCEIAWACKLALELGFPQLKPAEFDKDNTAPWWSQYAHYSASMLYSETHSGWINQRSTMPHRSADRRHCMCDCSSLKSIIQMLDLI